MFAVRSIEVEGASPALAAEVACQLRPLDGRSLVALERRRSRAASSTRCRPFAASVVDRAFPHTLRIRVVPELPVAVLGAARSRGSSPARGRVIARDRARARRDLPRIWLPTTHRDSTRAPSSTDEPGRAGRPLARRVSSAAASRVGSPSCARSTVRSRSDFAAGSRSGSATPIDLAPEDRDRARHPADLALPGRAARTTSTSPSPSARSRGRNPQLSG